MDKVALAGKMTENNKTSGTLAPVNDRTSGTFWRLAWSKDWMSIVPWFLGGTGAPYFGVIATRNVVMRTLGPLALISVSVDKSLAEKESNSTKIEWINVKDRLPEDLTSNRYLVGRGTTDGEVTVMPAMFIQGEFMALTPYGTLEFENPTHWAEFPDLPNSSCPSEQD